MINEARYTPHSGESRTIVACQFRIGLDSPDACQYSCVEVVAHTAKFTYELVQCIEGIIVLAGQESHRIVGLIDCELQSICLRSESLYRVYDRRGHAFMNKKLVRGCPTVGSRPESCAPLHLPQHLRCSLRGVKCPL